MQAGDRCLSDVLAQPLHRGQSEGNLIPVQDLQEANLQQEKWRKEEPSLTTPPGPTQIMLSTVLWASAPASLGLLGGPYPPTAPSPVTPGLSRGPRPTAGPHAPRHLSHAPHSSSVAHFIDNKMEAKK